MRSLPPDPSISDVAPTDRNLTGYDEQHLLARIREMPCIGGAWQAAV
jgi:hypothetical protein